ncbi:hypothetical protein TYRP_001748 [Tyrophagus putrescentiae]|nr:hypothetical protein TYRP_001748 [Tyrophagus putrescentiae]
MTLTCRLEGHRCKDALQQLRLSLSGAVVGRLGAMSLEKATLRQIDGSASGHLLVLALSSARFAPFAPPFPERHHLGKGSEETGHEEPVAGGRLSGRRKEVVLWWLTSVDAVGGTGSRPKRRFA